jgi:hypothetical protein
LHTPLAHTLFVAQAVPFAHRPQSLVHWSPAFESPHSSVPSQKPSPQL